MRHLFGPTSFPADGTPVAVCLIKNGIYYLDRYFAHHRALGVSHFVFVDNGSEDGTVERIRAEPGAAVLHSTLPVKTFQNDLREHAARRYAANRWCLILDSDELFDFHGSDRMPISSLVSYLETGGYTGLAAQMLDLFPEGSLRGAARLSYPEAIEMFRYYDLSALDAHPYHSRSIGFWQLLSTNTLSNDAVKVFFGGVRKKIFGEDCCLTKHPLVHVSGRVVPGRHPHCSLHLRVADVSALVRHYKFANDPAARDAATVSGGVLRHGEDRIRLECFQTKPDLSLHTETALPFEGIPPLVDRGFLISSPAYERWLQRLRPGSAGTDPCPSGPANPEGA